jgi:hypothetical protein
MSFVTWNRRNDLQREMVRRVRHLCQSVHEIKGPFETLVYRSDPDWLGVRVGVGSWFPESRLKEVQRVAFSTFEFPGTTPPDDQGIVWTHFRIC